MNILEHFCNRKALLRAARYAGKCTSISILFGNAEEARDRARTAAHLGSMVLLRDASVRRKEKLGRRNSAKVLKRETKYTPGPWNYCGEQAGSVCQCRMIWSIPGDVPVFTAQADKMAMVGLAHHKWGDSPDLIYWEIPLAQTEANARLIAATPDLLKELAHLVTLLEPLEIDGGLQVPGLATLNGARAAIAKALGSKPADREESDTEQSRRQR